MVAVAEELQLPDKVVGSFCVLSSFSSVQFAVLQKPISHIDGIPSFNVLHGMNVFY